jgi:hypothetical protein
MEKNSPAVRTVLAPLKRFLVRARTRRQSYREGRRGTVYKIVHARDHLHLSWLTMENDRGVNSLEWSEVLSVTGFKRDLFAGDLICLEFESKRGFFLIHEEMEGWASLIKRLPDYLPGCKREEEWYDVVMLPPFDLNLTPIFDKKSTPIERPKETTSDE